MDERFWAACRRVPVPHCLVRKANNTEYGVVEMFKFRRSHLRVLLAAGVCAVLMAPATAVAQDGLSNPTEAQYEPQSQIQEPTPPVVVAAAVGRLRPTRATAQPRAARAPCPSPGWTSWSWSGPLWRCSLRGSCSASCLHHARPVPDRCDRAVALHRRPTAHPLVRRDWSLCLGPAGASSQER